MAEFKCKAFTEAEIKTLPKQIKEFYDELYDLSKGFQSFYLKEKGISEQDKTLYNIIRKNLDSQKKTEVKPKKDKSGFVPQSKGKKPVKAAPVQSSTKKQKTMASKSKEAGIVNSFVAMVGKRKTIKNYEELLSKVEKAIENGENTERLKYIKTSLKNVLKDGQTMFTLGKVGEKLFEVAILDGIKKRLSIKKLSRVKKEKLVKKREKTRDKSQTDMFSKHIDKQQSLFGNFESEDYIDALYDYYKNDLYFKGLELVNVKKSKNNLTATDKVSGKEATISYDEKAGFYIVSIGNKTIRFTTHNIWEAVSNGNSANEKDYANKSMIKMAAEQKQKEEAYYASLQPVRKKAKVSEKQQSLFGKKKCAKKKA